ncbi:HesB-like protein [Clostridium sp. DJ247]|uniref:HesB-like protein n=1 Tax=Clostridium sp. DJ247 TaxID=2726188 RepID=UPI0016292912|nr:HesB-like protein [Clostridium sp. DJ247]MBC2581655.1 HesB-like protein [Clostridium sp. DJ247]
MNFLKISDLAYKEFKNFLEGKNADSNNVRIYVGGTSCHGPFFNITIDEARQGDLTQKVEDITFIVNKGIFAEYGDFVLLCGEENGLGTFSIEPVIAPESSGCSGCAGCS